MAGEHLTGFMCVIVKNRGKTVFNIYLQLMKLGAGLNSRPSIGSGSSVFSPARTIHSSVCSHSNTVHCWDAHISSTKSAVDTHNKTIHHHCYCYHLLRPNTSRSFSLIVITMSLTLSLIFVCLIFHVQPNLFILFATWIFAPPALHLPSHPDLKDPAVSQ